MNWLVNFFSSAAVTRRQTGTATGLNLRKNFKRALTRIKKLFKYVPKRFRAFAVTACIALVLIAPLYLIYRRSIGKNMLIGLPTLPSLFPSTAAPTLPNFDAEVLVSDPGVQGKRWKYIVIHHSASTRGSAQIFDQAHRERGWRSLGYHFVIGNGTDQPEGFIAPGPRWYSQETGAHAHSTEHNEFGIGICLVGNFDLNRPTAAQWSALVNLTKRLTRKYSISAGNLVGHNLIRQGGSTACPGKNFPLQELREAVFFEGDRR